MGICGEIRFDGGMPSIDSVTRMNRVLSPRGPDGSGIFQAGRLAVGHQRLKILDLSEHAQQPMIDNELGLGIVFNGCIYNFRDLRTRFSCTLVTISFGWRYRRSSSRPTPPGARIASITSRACLRLRSGSATPAASSSPGIVSASPLYYAETAGALRFASTLPALLATDGIDTSIDPVALHHYMSFHAVVPAPHTMIRGAQAAAGDRTCVIDADGRSRDHCYWRLHYGLQGDDKSMGYEDWQEVTPAPLRQAVERRLISRTSRSVCCHRWA